MPRCTTSCPWKLHAPSHPAPPRLAGTHSNRSKHSAKAKKGKNYSNGSQTAYVEGDSAPNSGLGFLFGGDERGGHGAARGRERSDVGIRSLGNKRIHPRRHALPPAFQPHPYELVGIKPQMDVRVSPCSRGEGKKKRRRKHPFYVGLGQRRETRRLPQLRQRRGARRRQELFGAGAARISASCTEPSAVSVLSKSKIMSESTLPPIPR